MPDTRLITGNAKGPSFSFRCRFATLFNSAIQQRVTLEENYNTVKCVDPCQFCDPYYDHLDNMRLALATSSDSESEEPDSGNPEVLPIGESTLDDVFYLQSLRAYLKYPEILEEVGDGEEFEVGGTTVLHMLQDALHMHKEEINAVAVVQELQIFKQRTQEAEDKAEKIGIQYGTVVRERDRLRQELIDTTANLQQTLADIQAESAEDKKLLHQANSPAGNASKRPADSDPLEVRSSKRLTLIDQGSSLPTTVTPLISNSLNDPNSSHMSWDQMWTHWNQQPMPGPRDDPVILAQWIQHHEHQNFKGIPTQGPEWIVNLRAARGHQLVMGLVPPKKARIDSSQCSGDPWRYRGRCITAVLRILTVPGRYRDLTLQSEIQILSPGIHPCQWGRDADLLTATNIALLLAARGISVPTADDTWLFCHLFILAQMQASEPGFVVEELNLLLGEERTALASRPPPLLASRPLPLLETGIRGQVSQKHSRQTSANQNRFTTCASGKG
ncbi:hypothetical protein C8R47DRAFT_1080092 [Mycena vitilis]|nr:hypothetical protein C8R47DRAFT_1080092 [Mycena vitilis]